MSTTPTLDTLARKFSALLVEVLGADVMRDVNERNASPEYAGSCATHDYCDANMVMSEAFTRVHGREFDFSDADMDTLNAAWDTARINKFYI